MITPKVRISASDPKVLSALAAIRADLKLQAEFSAEVLQETEKVIAEIELPELSMLDVPFVTIDPEGSMDLDQAMQIERQGTGYLVRFAIANLPAFVQPGGAIDLEARKRGQTLYPPDGKIPLHPFPISEGAASLLPNEVRGAYVWSFQLDEAAKVQTVSLQLAKVKSVHKYSYDEVQRLIDQSEASETLNLLREVGQKRQFLERERGGASLGRPEQEVKEVSGEFELIRRTPLPVEGWNAQISLMTGIEAAKVMVAGKVGILRTMPSPDPKSIVWFRHRTQALSKPWLKEQEYGEYLSSLDPNDPKQLAIMHSAATLFRGAGYKSFNGEVPEDCGQWAVASVYSHTTAPLRRLVDRFVLVICDCLLNSKPIPSWVTEALPEVPELMATSDGISGRLNAAVLSCVEAAILSTKIGQEFDASVVSTNESGGEILLEDLAITAHCDGELKAGSEVRARLQVADISTGKVQFSVVSVRDGSAHH